MRELLNCAAQMGIPRVDLEVDRANSVAQGLYASHGFIVDEGHSNASALRMYKVF